MPTYEIQNQKTGEVEEVFCSYDDKEKELKKRGKDWIYLISAPGLCFEGSVAKISKVSSGFKDVLKGIKKGSDRNNTMPDM